MNPTQRLKEVVTRLNPKQFARLLLFAESLAASSDVQSVGAFPEPLRERLRELTRRSEAEILNEAECAEYIALAEQLENADAARLEAAARLGQQENIPIAEALERLVLGALGRG